MDPLDPFFTQYERDVESGGPRPLEEYQELWPGLADEIATVYAELQHTQKVDAGAPWWERKPSKPLEQVGPYRILRPLGAGGMGIVYLAEEAHPKRAVALKILRPELVQPIALKRFEHEAELLGRVQHPGIAQIHGAGRASTNWGEVPYIAMQYVEGVPLSEVVHSTRPTSDAVAREDASRSATTADVPGFARIIESVALALHAAHTAGVVHRDVKPGNIMMTPDDRPVLVDFGIARDQEGVLATLTRTHDAPGTPLYMAPEQAAGSDVDHRTDIWALGVTLYECVAGHRPFTGATAEAVRRQIAEEQLPPARRLARTLRIPLDLAVIIETALRKDRAHRYGSAEAMARDLRSWRQGRPIAARPLSLIGRGARWARREPALAALLVVALVTLPTIASLLTRHIENRPRIEAAEAAERGRERDRLLALAFLELGDGQLTDTLPLFDAALALDPNSAEAVGGRILTLLRLRRLDEAEAELAAPGGVLTGTDAHEELAARLAKARDPTVGFAGPGVPPTSALDFFMKGQSLCSMGHGDMAHGMPPPKYFTYAIETLTRAALLLPEANQLYLIEAAHAATHAKDRVACYRFAQILEARFPGSAVAMHRVGLAMEAVGEIDRAQAALRTAHELDESWALPPLHLGRILVGLEEFEDAERFLRRALDLQRSGIVVFNLAACMNAQGRRAEAIALYRETVALGPDRPYGHFNLAMALEADGKPTEAIAAFRRVVEVAPHWKWAYMHLGRLLSSANDLEASEAILRRWTVRSPKDPVGWSNLAVTLRQAGRTADAIAAYAEACKFDPKNAKLQMRLGATIWASDPARSAAAYRRATVLAPRNADAWHYLGRMLQAQRKYREALAAFNRAQSLTTSRPRWTHRAENIRRQNSCRSKVSKTGSAPR